jgi:S1-C subfamily serine protease
LPPHQIQGRLEGGVVVVARLYQCDRCPRSHVSASSGFLVCPSGVVVTSAHALEGAPGDAIAIMTADARIHPLTGLLARDPDNDIAVVQARGSGFRALAMTPEVRVGSPAHVISHPASHFYVLTSGIVARARATRGGPPELMVTAEFARGSSGAPVFDDHGNVIGMARSTRSIYYEEKDGAQANLQMVMRYCVPSGAILDVLDAVADKRN